MGQIAKEIMQILKARGYQNFVGVPCSLLKGIYKILENEQADDILYVPAVREDSAIGVASGMYLGGKKSVVLMQNSGLGYSMNVLTSMNLIYKIPVLLIISWRGYDSTDAIEHKIIGERLTNVLESVDIDYFELDESKVEETIMRCIGLMESTMKPVALLINKKI
jgi:phosphonopyruvate decarboxylase